METQNTNSNSNVAEQQATSVEPPTPTHETNSASQEVSSTTPGAAYIPTKRSLRFQIWKKLKYNNYALRHRQIFNRIPTFVGAQKAALNLIETDEFKNAKNIKIMIDKALHHIKVKTLLAGKNLYFPSTRESAAVFLKVEGPENLDENNVHSVLNVRDIRNHRKEIFMEDQVKLDMIVIGSVVVSRNGYRIGHGNGFNDLYVGILIETQAITPDTLIVTMVHDAQVVDQIPENLFQAHDTPVDMIVTPTEVIRVANRLPRPAGIYWQLLSERRLEILPVLSAIKESQEKAGKTVTLKETDTDIEANIYDRSRRRGMMRRHFVGRRFVRRAISQTDTDQQQNHQYDNNMRQRRFVRRYNRYYNNRRRRPTKSEGDQSVSRDRRMAGNADNRRGDDNSQQKRQRQRKNRLDIDFSIKVTNLRRGIRIKQLKAELRKRQCNPMDITWNVTSGRCLLHFGSRDGQRSTQEDMEKVLNALSNLSLTVNPDNYSHNNSNGADGDGNDNGRRQKGTPKVINLNVELLKRNDKKGNTNTNPVNGESSGNAGDNSRINAGGKSGDFLFGFPPSERRKSAESASGNFALGLPRAEGYK